MTCSPSRLYSNRFGSSIGGFNIMKGDRNTAAIPRNTLCMPAPDLARIAYCMLRVKNSMTERVFEYCENL